MGKVLQLDKHELAGFPNKYLLLLSNSMMNTNATINIENNSEYHQKCPKSNADIRIVGPDWFFKLEYVRKFTSILKF